MALFLDDLIETFYEPIGPDFRHSYARGQIFNIHMGYTREDINLWRPTGLDSSKTTVNSFKIEPAGGDAFRRSMPLYIPPLETNEEFIVVKAKKRPVILLNPAPPKLEIQGLKGGGRMYRPLCIVVPVYSLVDRFTEKLKFPQSFVNRMRVMRLPEFFFYHNMQGGSAAHLLPDCQSYRLSTSPILNLRIYACMGTC